MIRTNMFKKLLLIITLLLPPPYLHAQEEPDLRSPAIALVGFLIAAAGAIYMSEKGPESFKECCKSLALIIVGSGVILASSDIVAAYDTPQRPGVSFSFRM
jgi:hypothetical protein